MRLILSSMLAGATLIGSTILAFAGEGQGVIETIDLDNRTITLTDGSEWQVEESVSLDGLVAGDSILVVFEDGTSNLISVTKSE
ncbi:MAG: copper-binding protein [Pseudomonadota bacterium]